MATIDTGHSRIIPTIGPGQGARPASIQELARRAEFEWDPSKDFKFWLKVAEKARHQAQAHDAHGDLENAFVEYARAATLILDKIPTHKDYHVRLDQIQRDTLISKGKGVLDRMSLIKPPLIDRHNAWEAAQVRGGSANVAARPQPPPSSFNSEPRQRDGPSRRSSINRNKDERQYWYPSSSSEKVRVRESPHQVVSKPHNSQQTRIEQEGILRRQRESEEDARVARKVAMYGSRPPSRPGPPSGPVSMPVPSIIAPKQISSQPSSSRSEFEMPPLLPLECPRRYDGDSADAETEENHDGNLYKRVAELNLVSQNSYDSPFGGPLPPITTTSAIPPSLSPISYPQLMTTHQRTQGYTPSYQPIPMPPIQNVFQPSLMLENTPQISNLYQNMLPTPSQPAPVVDAPQRDRAYMYGPREPPQHTHSHSPSRSFATSLYSSMPLRPQYDAVPPRAHPLPIPGGSQSIQPETISPRVAPATTNERIEQESNGLKTVHFPRAVLPRFLSIASVNTAKNRETCGLLLGKRRSNKYVVTTLLIPKQHSTSDTCSMDEEELVLEFSETRSLITIGWIHTHPTQSCFMSSVDLHTHSGYQRMLPEAFAVVCAPQHTPNFGIFRLTDPPGLQTILSCDQKNAFHPHPELPIYTDADKGHVQMKDMSLEIVDLR